MFSPEVYTLGWASRQRRSLSNCDPGLLQKCVYALTLLGHLAESGLSFLFKGGTSLLLHLEKIRRLSIDIDIVSPAPDADLERVVARIGQSQPFCGHSEDRRGTSTGRPCLPRRRHFKIWYDTQAAEGGRGFVLLDVVQESDWPHQTVRLPLRTEFLNPEREIKVTVPTIDSLLGDKLTAFAPTTIGVPLRRPNQEEGDVMQVAKQLFDVGVLFDHATDFAAVREAYDGVQAQESGYRGSCHSRDASLDDTLNACLGLTAENLRNAPNHLFPDCRLIVDGFRRLQGHLIEPVTTVEARRRYAARTGCLAACLRTGRSLDFVAVRYTHSAEQVEALRTATLSGHEHAWLERLRSTNPEAFHYWYHALRSG